jgi:hypothetical protein
MAIKFLEQFTNNGTLIVNMLWDLETEPGIIDKVLGSIIAEGGFRIREDDYISTIINSKNIDKYRLSKLSFLTKERVMIKDFDENEFLYLFDDINKIKDKIKVSLRKAAWREAMNYINYRKMFWYRNDDLVSLANELEPFLERKEYGTIKQAYEIISEILDKRKMKSEIEAIRAKGKPGYIYLIVAENGMCKIGKTQNIEKRMNPFKVKFPMNWELIYSFQTENYTLAEKRLHKLFNEKRSIGEWFSLTEEDIEYIKSIRDFTM